MGDDPLDLFGQWWLPDKPDRRLNGRLWFTAEEGARLELAGELGIPWGRPGTVSVGEPIFGVDVRGRAITLLDATWAGQQRSGRATSERARGHTLLVGARHPDSQPAFYGCTVSFSDFTEWVATQYPLINYDHGSTDEADFVVKVAPPQRRHIDLESGRLTLFVGAGQTMGDIESKINLSAAWVYTTTSPLRYEQLLNNVVDPLDRLHALLTGGPSDIREIKVHLPANEDELVSVETLDVFSTTLRGEASDRSTRWEWPGPLNKVHTRLEEIVSAWFSLYEKCRIPISLFFGVLEGRTLFLESRYQMLAQAVEAYHRHHPSFRNEVLLPEEHEHRLRAILDGAPNQHHDWLEARLRYANEPTLRRRLKDLLAYAGPIATAAISEDLLEEMIAARNELTHVIQREIRENDRANEVHWLGEKLALMLRACLLRDIGFSMDEIEEALLKSRHNQLVVSVLPSDHARDQ